MDTKISKLPWRLKLSYSIGHVLNDLCSCMWFTYLLLYFHFVLQFNNALAGVVLLIGQIADGIATPFIGIEADRVGTFQCGYGRRKTWHLIGTICVFSTFPFLFIRCIGCEHSSDWAQLIYYSAFVVIFQFGWAAVQISHLALIPDLASDSSERTELNALRYSFTVMSNICVYVVTWIVLGISVDSDNPDDHEKIGPEDALKFRNIVLVIVGVGVLHSLLFHCGVKEDKRHYSLNKLDLLPSSTVHRVSWKAWFLKGHFYKVALIYMLTRLSFNLAQVYVPLYLQDSLNLREISIAVIPLVMYSAGFVSSFFMKPLNKHAGRKITYLIGGCLVVGACIWIYFGDGDSYKNYQLYAVIILLGVGSSTILVTSLSITADLIGNNVESGAFVYGAMSFSDKLSNGIVIFVIQYFNPCQGCCHSCAYFFRDVLAWVCGGAAILAFIPLLSLRSFKTYDRRTDPDLTSTVDETTPILAEQS